MIKMPARQTVRVVLEEPLFRLTLKQRRIFKAASNAKAKTSMQKTEKHILEPAKVSGPVRTKSGWLFTVVINHPTEKIVLKNNINKCIYQLNRG